MTSAPISDPLREMESLTKRQREVLALAAKGMTNPEIGDRLGISKDGAKWHIGEILMRLDVDTREEAVDLWRRYNGLPYRLHRVMRAVLGPVAVRWLIGGVGATAVAGLAVVLVVLAVQGSDSPKADVTPPAATSTTTAVASPTPETLDGIPVVGAHVGEGTTLAEGTVLYMASGCTSCDTPARSIDRVVIGADGEATHTSVYSVPNVGTTGESPDGKYISSVATSPDGYGIVVGVCTSGYCGNVGNVTPDAATTYYASYDGGMSWTSIGTLAGGGRVLSVATVGTTTATAFVQQTPGGGVTPTYLMLPGNNPATVSQVAGGTTWAKSGGWNYQLVHASDRTSVVGALHIGAALTPELPTGANIIGAWSTSGGFAIVWNMQQANKTVTYLGSMGLNGNKEPRTSGKPQSAIQWTAVSLLAFNGILLDATHAMVTVNMTDAQAGVTSGLGHIAEPAVVDLTTGAIAPVGGYLLDRAKSGDRSNILAVTSGSFTEVHGTGNCLNVRTAASTSAGSLGCYKDGVLLRQRGLSMDADDRTWTAVTTPLNEQGWAASEYLEPVATVATVQTGPYPATTRTGNPDIDPVLAAIESGDGNQLVAVTQYTSETCQVDPHRIGAVTCPTGVADGSTIEGIGSSSCEGGLVPKSQYEASPNVPGIGMPLYAIYHATSSQDWQYTVMFTNPANGLAAAVYVTKGKIVGLWSGCGETPAQVLSEQPHGDVVLAPKMP